jgi:hypothetical protein
MATTFKTLTTNDVVNTRTLLHEAIPLTGTIASGTYADLNIKKFSHGMFESVFDYPFLSSSANHIFDLTFGYSADSNYSSSVSNQNSKKLNIYNQMAQVLVGYDATGSIQRFDQDGDIAAGGEKMDEAFFVNFSRLLTKDEIKKDSFRFTLVTGGAPSAFVAGTTMTIGDYGAINSYKVNSPAGEYGILYTSSAAPTSDSGVGLIYYQAGIVVLSSSILQGTLPGGLAGRTAIGPGVASGTLESLATGSSIDVLADSFRNRIMDISFNNTVELNSSVYFCRAGHSEFNYSNNPTYLSSSQIVVKNSSTDNPVSYVTTVGLYSADNELLAVAKLSEPLQKDPSTELTLRVRLDY